MAHLVKEVSTDELLNELKTVCQEIRYLIKAQPPRSLIGYLWAQLMRSLIDRRDPKRDKGGLPSVASNENALVFAMEYIHATIAVDGISEEATKLDEAQAKKIIELSDQALSLCFRYGMAASSTENAVMSIEDKKIGFDILSNWVLIRGRRFQVLEEEFFSYVLAPHDTAIRDIYGITAVTFAKEIQKIANAARTGVDRAQQRMLKMMQKVATEKVKGRKNWPNLIAATKNKNPQFDKEMIDIFDDMFNGGIFNLTKNSDLPQKLLADLAYTPGRNLEFDDASPIAGTPFKTLPARVRPLVLLGDEYYCTEPNFIRDASYRTLQRALISHNAAYREEWNKRQKGMSENAFPDLMSEHLKGATVLKDVYYPIGKNRWAETDCVILLDDVLLNIEAKAGSEALSAPAENLKAHIDSIEGLVKSAYRQSKRFIDYIHQRPEAPLYERRADGKYSEVARVTVAKLRKIFPIGLTVEAFTPFSASVKEDGEVTAMQSRYNFVSLSIDDLMVIRQILGGTGEFLHYLDVRQSLAGLKNAILFDEIDHLGIYISQNRADEKIKRLMEEHQADHVWIDGMDQDIIAPYFADSKWPNSNKPAQKYPAKTRELLETLEQTRAAHWLEADNFIRDLSDDGRAQFADNFESSFSNLNAKPLTYFAVGGGVIAVFGLMRVNTPNFRAILTARAEAVALAFAEQRVRLFELLVGPSGNIKLARMIWVKAPSMLRKDYGEISYEAQHLKSKIKPL